MKMRGLRPFKMVPSFIFESATHAAVTANISAITAKKMGKARDLWVTIRSMRSDREISCSCRR